MRVLVLRSLALLILAATLSGCGYNDIQRKDEAVKAAWSQVLNVYKRRADLIPSLVNTVKGYAAHEQQVLTAVTAARAKVGDIQVDADDPASLQAFQAAQSELSGALSRLLVVSENYPTLKADQSFLNLQTQLEGTENRIAVERQRYIESVQAYNTLIREFPVNLTAMMFGYEQKPNFTVENEREIQAPPMVDFGAPPPPPPAQAQPIMPVPAPPSLAPTPSASDQPMPEPVPYPGQQPLPPPPPSGG